MIDSITNINKLLWKYYSYKEASEEDMTTERSKSQPYKAYIHSLKMWIRVNMMN